MFGGEGDGVAQQIVVTRGRHCQSPSIGKHDEEDTNCGRAGGVRLLEKRIEAIRNYGDAHLGSEDCRKCVAVGGG